MTRLERLLLLAFFVAVLAVLASSELTATVVGGVGGAGAGVAVAGRMHRLSTRMDATLGTDPVRVRGVRPRSLALRAAAHLGVLLALLLTTVFVPFVGDELFAGCAAAATTLPAVLTAWRLRR